MTPLFEVLAVVVADVFTLGRIGRPPGVVVAALEVEEGTLVDLVMLFWETCSP